MSRFLLPRAAAAARAAAAPAAVASRSSSCASSSLWSACPTRRGFAASAASPDLPPFGQGSGPRLQGKVAIVTGAAAGIGRAAAIVFAREGAKVVCADMNAPGVEATADLIVKAGGQALALQCDVSKEAAVENAVQKALSEFSGLHVIFNNAGIMHPSDDDGQTVPESVWDQTMNINVKGVWYGCKHAIPAMVKSGGGSVINTASFVALRGAATPQLAYTASKGAVLAMSRELAVIYARQNVRVNALCPGPLRTELLMNFLDTDEKKNRRLVHVPVGRFGEAEELARGALFLASDDSTYVTGTEFLVDGGICAAYVTAEGSGSSVPSYVGKV